MSIHRTVLFLLGASFFLMSLGSGNLHSAQAQVIATTTLTISVCGNYLVDSNEDCDEGGPEGTETGEYSETIAGRECDIDCTWGPYCGDGILQIAFGEECDDGNNDDGDFCSSSCEIEPAGSGGGGSSGGGGRSSGGGSEDLGETQINVSGRSYPRQMVHVLLDTEDVGTVRASADGYFDFATEASPGTVSMGFWAQDADGNRSITLNNTFDVTQGAITNISGILLPPTLVIDDQTVNPGDTVVFSGQAIPNVDVEIHFNSSEIVLPAVAGPDGKWALSYNTADISADEYTVKARYQVGSGSLTTDSSFSTALQLFLGVDGQPTTPSDLNRDGFVDLIDFSILIFWWQTNGGDSDPPADINGNSNVGLEDFSILLFNWTG